MNELLARDSYNKVIALIRKPHSINRRKLEQYVVDFGNLEKSSLLITADDVYCTLGTTIRKAGSQEAFEKLDFVYPVQVAKLAATNGANQELLLKRWR